MANEYKDPNTDIMKALSKAVDAATGETGTQYEYKNPNTDVIQKLEELTEAIATSGGGSHNYSTSEQVVGTWIDGSTLYEKTIEKVVTCGSEQTIINTTDIPNLDKIITVEGAFGGVPLTYYDSANYRSYVFVDNSNHALKGYIKFDNIPTMNSYFIIRYTKTST